MIQQALLSVSDKTGLDRLRARPGRAGRRAALDRRHREGARRRGARRHRRRRLHRLSRDARRAREDAAPEGARRASSRAAISRRTVDAIARARHPDDRPGGREPLSVPRDRGEARLHARRGDREHRHRRSVDAALGGEEPRRTSASSSIRPTTRRCSRSCDARQRRARAGDALPPRAEGLRAHRRLRRRDRQLADRARAPTVSRPAFPASFRYAGELLQDAALRREPAPARGVLPRTSGRRPAASPRSASCRARSSPTTTSPTPMPPGSA